MAGLIPETEADRQINHTSTHTEFAELNESNPRIVEAAEPPISPEEKAQPSRPSSAPAVLPDKTDQKEDGYKVPDPGQTPWLSYVAGDPTAPEHVWLDACHQLNKAAEMSSQSDKKPGKKRTLLIVSGLILILAAATAFIAVQKPDLYATIFGGKDSSVSEQIARNDIDVYRDDAFERIRQNWTVASDNIKLLTAKIEINRDGQLHGFLDITAPGASDKASFEKAWSQATDVINATKFPPLPASYKGNRVAFTFDIPTAPEAEQQHRLNDIGPYFHYIQKRIAMLWHHKGNIDRGAAIIKIGKDGKVLDVNMEDFGDQNASEAAERELKAITFAPIPKVFQGPHIFFKVKMSRLAALAKQ
jgi:hypothetical protein